MAARLNTMNADKLNTGVKSIVSEIEIRFDKVKQLEGNEELYNKMQCIVKSLSAEGENINYATEVSNLEESLQKEQSFYLSKTGISINTLPENSELEFAAKILQETGVDDYNSSSLFTKYMSMIEKCNKQKEIIDSIDEHINRLKIAIEQQNDLKCELCNINYIPVGYTAEPVSINTVESLHNDDNFEKIVELVRKIHDIEKKQADICEKTSELKSEQKKMYHGLPPNMDQAVMAVHTIEQKMKSVSKHLIKKLEKE